MRMKRIDCERTTCHGLKGEARATCTYMCVSPSCFDEVYAQDPVRLTRHCLRAPEGSHLLTERRNENRSAHSRLLNRLRFWSCCIQAPLSFWTVQRHADLFMLNFLSVSQALKCLLQQDLDVCCWSAVSSHLLCWGFLRSACRLRPLAACCSSISI